MVADSANLRIDFFWRLFELLFLVQVWFLVAIIAAAIIATPIEP